jgi:general secretion pathway protein A
MYKKFFGFKERPFQLVPNPAYLFLSKCHEEAMAHLSYAISQGDGFVEITGEVGTGKTTLCRAFLDQLGRETEVAYVFNPKLDSIQLLKAINDEFGISSEASNAKDLIDGLNSFLLRRKAEGKTVIVLIDEAQNLSKEVLEQLRLLSNLETNTSKLLQIILVGQPELGEMLDSHELRQLAQRITLSSHLTPLTKKETGKYIEHRLHVASQKPGVQFTRSAFRTIYKYSGGIPRLINIASDRALLTAFGLNKKKITGKIAKASIRELAGRGEMKRVGFQLGRRGALLTAVFAALIISFLYILSLTAIFSPSKEGSLSRTFMTDEKEKPIVTQKVPPANGIEERLDIESAPASVKEAPPPEVKGGPSPLKRLTSGAELRDLLTEMSPRVSRTTALRAALGLWPDKPEVSPLLEEVEDDSVFFNLGAKQNGLLVQRIEGDMNLLKRLNHPAILEFKTSDGLGSRYLALAKMSSWGVVLRGAGEEEWIEVGPEQFIPHWSRVAYVMWKDFLGNPGAIASNSPGESVVALKMFMHDLGYHDIEMNPAYDFKTLEIVKGIQRAHGLQADGVVGPLTKMVLFNEKSSLRIPHIAD